MNLIFIHVPKNAGTSIKRYLENHGISVPRRHIPFKMLPKNSDFSFAVIRNPWDRHLSIFLHLKYNLRQIAIRTKFEDYLRRQWGIFSTPQIDFVEGVKHILRFENLQEDFKVVQEYLGTTEPLVKIFPFNNSTKHGDYREYYTDETREMVEEISLKDMVFGYEF